MDFCFVLRIRRRAKQQKVYCEDSFHCQLLLILQTVEKNRISLASYHRADLAPVTILLRKQFLSRTSFSANANRQDDDIKITEMIIACSIVMK
jgi:hypothetical protein